jgi:uncharacterized protein Yka (UPF0111/DUF47 family)
MSRRRWFLPDTPDVAGILRRQTQAAIEGLDALRAWADGDAGAATALGDAEARGDAARRDLLGALRAAFVLPLEPEDAFTLSRGLDRILHRARDLVREAEVMDFAPPDPGLAAMAGRLAEAARHVDEAIARLGDDDEAATRSAEAAIEAERVSQRNYYDGMAALLDVGDRSERIARRELYRRCSRIGELVVDVAERVIYAVVKES